MTINLLYTVLKIVEQFVEGYLGLVKVEQGRHVVILSLEVQAVGLGEVNA